jgi:hypothetical protein
LDPGRAGQAGTIGRRPVGRLLGQNQFSLAGNAKFVLHGLVFYEYLPGAADQLPAVHYIVDYPGSALAGIPVVTRGVTGVGMQYLHESE